ncbi:MULTISPECIES: class C sortase [unclassified Butyrivibrio]|uniref:class C sortase n=1 Tax=unclassified Butyrivibrio TaxID=2639466 RepID=UPI0003B7B62C|nr:MULTISPECIES: class C sortase [unclassified Butyrivibrio]SEL10364.1 sortase A [Butyrivibrio sp. ob235]
MKSKGFAKQLPNIIFTAIFVVGLGIFLYPSVSNYINTKNQTRAIDTYSEALEDLTSADYEKFWNEAQEYNEKIASRGMNFNLSEEELAEYHSILDPTGTGVMGHIEIEKLGVDLPIYHDVTESVLQVGIGHIPGSSLPAGTTGSHAILSGHRGLPSAKLFSDLDQMIEGDTFLLHIMNQTFAYQVDNISIVLPEETQSLTIYPDKDYVTLVTCTPYGVNTHRMLVRGRRVDYNEESRLIVPADATKINNLLVAPFIAGPIILVLFIWFVISTSDHGKKKKSATVEDLRRHLR